MIPPPDLNKLTETEKDALILALWAQVQTLTARVAALEARLSQPAKTPGNSSLPPSKGHKANRPERARPPGPRQGSLGRQGGGRPLAEEPDQRVIAKAAACAHCRAALGENDQVLHARGACPRAGLAGPGGQGRAAADQAGGHQGRALSGPLPVLRRDHAGAGAGGDGAGHAVRCLDPGAGALPALYPRHQLSAADPAVPAPVSRCRSARERWTRCSGAPSRGLTTRPPPSSLACAVPGWSVPTRPRCASMAGPAGTGCSRTRRW